MAYLKSTRFSKGSVQRWAEITAHLSSRSGAAQCKTWTFLSAGKSKKRKRERENLLGKTDFPFSSYGDVRARLHSPLFPSLPPNGRSFPLSQLLISVSFPSDSPHLLRAPARKFVFSLFSVFNAVSANPLPLHLILFSPDLSPSLFFWRKWAREKSRPFVSVARDLSLLLGFFHIYARSRDGWKSSVLLKDLRRGGSGLFLRPVGRISVDIIQRGQRAAERISTSLRIVGADTIMESI